jgi:hypothetical protein
MRRVAALAELERLVQRQFGRLRYQALQARASPLAIEREPLITDTVINTANSWSNFLRAYYVSCVFGTRTKSALNVKSAALFIDVNAAIGFAILEFTPHAAPNVFGVWHRRDEPPWHDPNTLLHLADVLGFQNLATIQAAFSLGLRVFIDLPVVRNFYAHRNQGTERAAQNIAANYGIPSSRPTQILFTNPLLRPQALVFEWLTELVITADFLCG